MINGKDISGKRQRKEERNLAQNIRRRMIQKDHGDMNKYTRKVKHRVEMNYKALILGSFLFLLGQVMVWYQINSQFLSNWVKERPIIMSLLGVPISYIYIYATYYTVQAFDGSLWPQRLIGFSMGMISFAFLTYIHLNETLTPKTLVTLGLATAIVLIQVLWK